MEGTACEFLSRGVKIEVGDMLPSSHYAERWKRCRLLGTRPRVNASSDPAVLCVEFVLAGLYLDRISRNQQHGRIEYAT